MSGLMFTLLVIYSIITAGVVTYVTSKIWPGIYGDF